MSRAEPLPVTRGVGLRSALREAAFDFYYQSIRLVPANVLWGIALLVVLAIMISSGPIATFVVAPLLAIPYVGVVRIAVLAARGRDVVLSDVLRAYRQFALPALVLGVSTTMVMAVLASNVVLGAGAGNPVGWAFATLAASGLLALWTVGFPLWVLLVDPEREDRPLQERMRLAVLLVLAAPVRLGALALVLTMILAASTVAFAALLTISVAYVGLVTARYILPLADRLEAWLATRQAEGSAD